MLLGLGRQPISGYFGMNLPSEADYAALLRGMNVGGRNLIKVPELRACFERHGFRTVAPYTTRK